jgi:superoxide dismutase, Fe-Mn family
MAWNLPELPYSKDALEPHISAETIDFHYGKHHQAYVNNLNNLTAGTELESKSLEELIKTAEGGVFNNAAQVWNHTFYWSCLTPKGAGAPSGALAEAINESFGSFDAFKETFSKAAATLFGSGWAWLVKDANGKLAIVQKSNAGNPIRDGQVPVLTCDVWEHAYYVDSRNARPAYVETFWKLVNWDFVSAQFLG